MEEKQIYFFSIEFLIGRLLKAYVNNLGWDTMVEETLDELGLTMKPFRQRNMTLHWGTAALAV